MQQHLQRLKQVTILWNTQVQEILGTDHVQGIRVQERKSSTSQELAQGLFVAHRPNTRSLTP